MTIVQDHIAAVRLNLMAMGIPAQQAEALALAVAHGMDGSALALSAAVLVSAWASEAKEGRGVAFSMRVLAMLQGKPAVGLADVIQLDDYRTVREPGAGAA